MYKLNQLPFFLKKWLNKNVTIEFCFILFLLLCSCKEKGASLNNDSILFSKFSKESNISFREVYEFKKGSAYNLYLVDSTLIIYDERRGNNFHFYNYSLKSNELSKGYLSIGRGPSQALGAVSAGITDNLLWVHDITLKKILTIDKAKAVAQTNDSIVFDEYPVKNSYYKISLKDSLTYLGVGAMNSTFKIQEVNLLSGKETNELGTFKDLPDNIPFEAYKSAHQSFIFVNTSGEKVVLLYRFTDAIEIYDLKTKTGKKIQGPKIFNVDFKPLNIGKKHFVMERTKKTRFAFVGGVVTNKYIYALYSGNLTEKRDSRYGKYVYVYDWNGNPIKKIILDREIRCLVVSKDDKIMYAYDPYKGYIVKANMN